MPKKVKFEFSVPNSLFDEELSKEEFEKDVKIDAALKLFQKGHVSSGYAAEMLGMSLRDFRDLLQERGIPVSVYTEEDHEYGTKVMKDLDKKSKRKKKI